MLSTNVRTTVKAATAAITISLLLLCNGSTFSDPFIQLSLTNVLIAVHNYKDREIICDKSDISVQTELKF